MFTSFFPSRYKMRDRVMNDSEEAFFLEFKKRLPDRFYIFPKMRIADILETTNGEGFFKKRNKILPKHIDFLITNHSFAPVLAIELNGASHKGEERKNSDSEKRGFFKSVNLPLEFIQVGSEFSSEVDRLVNQYLRL